MKRYRKSGERPLKDHLQTSYHLCKRVITSEKYLNLQVAKHRDFHL